jgi:ABC-type branched-subunit amino acid transport system substrate-binding protein
VPIRERRLAWRVVLIALVAVIAAACGQKPGVHVATGSASGTDDGSGVSAGDNASGDDLGDLGSGDDLGGDDLGGGDLGTDPVDGTDTGADAGAGAGGSDTGDGGATDPGSEGAGDSGEPSGGGSGGSAGGGEPIGSDRTGAGDDRLVFAIHAPVTGAAPLPATSFEKARDLYWRHITQAQGQKVLGRSNVQVLFKDDKYTPQTAVQACREMAASAFFVVGGGGTDQIQACGRFANQAKVPYLSAGVTEAGLRGLSWYYAISMSYKQQGPLLAQYIKSAFPGKKVAAIVTDTPNFDDAIAGWEAGREAAGLPYYKTLRHPKNDTSWYSTYANELKGQGVQVVFMLTAPVDYIRFAQQANQQGFSPQYAGVGVSMGLNAVLGSGCPQVNGGTFLSPFPGLDWARRNVPEFFQAAQRFAVPNDDIAFILWGNARTQHEMLKRYEAAYGTDLTREQFRAFLETQQGVKSGIFPDLTYSSQDHFGAGTAHVLKANCSKEEYETVATFASTF